MKTVVCPTWWARIYISGPIGVAQQLLREECMREGLCVNIHATSYIYTGGEEAGYIVELVNYPRFPADPSEIDTRALDILRKLLKGTYQHSAMLMTPDQCTWVTTRSVE